MWMKVERFPQYMYDQPKNSFSWSGPLLVYELKNPVLPILSATKNTTNYKRKTMLQFLERKIKHNHCNFMRIGNNKFYTGTLCT